MDDLQEYIVERKARVLFYDIETFPELGMSWNRRESDTLWVEREGLMASFAWKWKGDKKVQVRGLPDYLTYKKEPYYDKMLVDDIYKLICEADVVIAHNGDRFDQKIVNTRFAKWGYDPIPGYKQVDTLKIARKHFRFPSNRLDDLGEFLGLGRKAQTGGIKLWKDCYYGDEKAWRKMIKYNKQDVVLLEQVYNKLMPWATTHPNMSVIQNAPDVCPKCGKNEGFVLNGWHHTNASKYRRLQCKACRSNVQSRTNIGIKPRYK